MPTDAIEIRPLAASDRTAWEQLFRAYIIFYKSNVPDDVIDDAFQAMMSGAAGTHRGFVALDTTGAIVGIAHILFHRSTWSKSGYVYLEDLFVAPGVRAKGIGRALIERVYTEADSLGAARTYWMTQEVNYRARGLYDQVATKSPFVQYRR